MTLHDWLRFAVIFSTATFAILAAALIWHWHKTPDGFDLRDLMMTMGADKKQHVSRPAVAELVALVSTTSAYLGAMAVKPDTFAEATLIYGGIWTARGSFSTYLRSKNGKKEEEKHEDEYDTKPRRRDREDRSRRD